MAIVAGAIAGSAAYALADWAVSRAGAHSRKRSGNQQANAGQGGGLAIAVAPGRDSGKRRSRTWTVKRKRHQHRDVGSNLPVQFPEGLPSALSMRAAGRSRFYIFGLWGTIAVLSRLAASAGAAFLGGASPQIVAAVSAVAGGALLTMVVNTMVPEAVGGEQKLAGFLVVVGLLVAFALSNVGEN